MKGVIKEAEIRGCTCCGFHRVWHPKTRLVNGGAWNGVRPVSEESEAFKKNSIRGGPIVTDSLIGDDCPEMREDAAVARLKQSVWHRIKLKELIDLVVGESLEGCMV